MVSFSVARPVEQRGGPVAHLFQKRLCGCRSSYEFLAVALGKGLPAVRVVMEPAAQFARGRQILAPDIDRRRFLLQPPGPKTIDQNTQAVALLRRVIDALQSEGCHGTLRASDRKSATGETGQAQSAREVRSSSARKASRAACRWCLRRQLGKRLQLPPSSRKHSTKGERLSRQRTTSPMVTSSGERAKKIPPRAPLRASRMSARASSRTTFRRWLRESPSSRASTSVVKRRSGSPAMHIRIRRPTSEKDARRMYLAGKYM